MKTRVHTKLPHLLYGLLLLPFTATAETLEEIYQQALANDHQFKAAQAAYAAGKESTSIGRAALLPQIGGQAQYIKVDTESESALPVIVPGGDGTDGIPPAAGSAPSAIESSGRTTSYSVSLEQALIDMSAWYGYQRGKALANQAEAQFVEAQQELILRVTRAYFEALNAVDTLETAAAEENALSHQLEQTRQRYEVGLTAITEVHEAQAAYDSATASRLIAQGNLGIAFEALEVLTGQPTDRLSPLEAGFPVQEPSPAARDEWVEFALENSPTLASASFNAEAAQQLAKARTSDHLPTLSAGVRYNDQNSRGESPFRDGQSIALFPYDTDEATTTFSVTLNVPLFSGGLTSASRRQANAGSLEAREIYRQTQRDVIQSTRSLHLAVNTDVATVKARKQAITSSRSALEATKAGYEVGTRDLVDVLNAQRSLFRAQRDYYDALYTYVQNTLRLKQVAGTLSGTDVAALNEWLDTSNPVIYQR